MFKTTSPSLRSAPPLPTPQVSAGIYAGSLTLDLESFGAVGDGIVDDTVAITTAFSTTASQGKALFGRYGAIYKTVGPVVSMPFQGVQFDGRGCTFVSYGLADGENAFRFFYQSLNAFDRTITADVSSGADTITLDDVSGFNVGDLISITRTNLFPTIHSYATIVADISGNDIKLQEAIPRGLSIDVATDTTNVSAVTPSKLATFRNANFDGSHITTAASAFFCFGCTQCTLEKLLFIDWIGDSSAAGSVTFQGHNLLIRDIIGRNSGTTGVSDISFYQISNSTIDNVNSEAANGFGIGFAYGAWNRISNLHASGAKNGRGIKSGGVLTSLYLNTTVSNCLDNEFCFTDGASYNTVVGLVSQGAQHIGGGRTIWLSDQANIGNTFIGGVTRGAVEYSFSNGSTDTDNVVIGFRLSGDITNTGKANFYAINGGNSQDFPLGNGDNNDFDLQFHWSDFLTISGPNAAFALTGITPGHDGRELTLFNDTAGNFTLKHENASSSAVNRLNTNNGADLTLNAGGSAILRYSTSVSRWIVVSPFV